VSADLVFRGGDVVSPTGRERCDLLVTQGILSGRAPSGQGEGREVGPDPSGDVIATMIEIGRPSRLKGAGFYEYDESGRRGRMWPGLTETFPPAQEQIPFVDVKDRMLFAEALETAKCFEEGVITSAAAANIGSIMGIGFPANTGGAAQFMTGYQALDSTGRPVGDVGLAAFVARADELAEKYGERFSPTQYLRDLVAKGESFPA
jgi:3-hydroxyacyl-CoA dehydrogenase / enoyl-CoA hydratase / 3-hydroxybutyryl-CoA epimerase